MNPAGTPGNRDIEYQATMSYVQHLYDTRHQIFQFAVALNSALLAAIFQFIQEGSGRLALGLVGLFVTSAITLMARRSRAYLVVLEGYGILVIFWAILTVSFISRVAST